MIYGFGNSDPVLRQGQKYGTWYYPHKFHQVTYHTYRTNRVFDQYRTRGKLFHIPNNSDAPRASIPVFCIDVH